MGLIRIMERRGDKIKGTHFMFTMTVESLGMSMSR